MSTISLWHTMTAAVCYTVYDIVFHSVMLDAGRVLSYFAGRCCGMMPDFQN